MKVLGKTRRAVLIATQGFAKLPSEPSGNQVRILAGIEFLAVCVALSIANGDASTTGECHDAFLECVDALYRPAREIGSRFLDLHFDVMQFHT